MITNGRRLLLISSTAPFLRKALRWARDSITGVDDSRKRVKSPISDRAEPQPMQ